MDKQFLEFWGTMMLSAAKGQQQLEDIMKWMAGNMRDFNDISGMFHRMYGIDPAAENAPDYAAIWQKVFNEFKDSYSELAAMMDLVPRKDYVVMSKENQDLKNRIAELEEAVRHLRTLLDDRVSSPVEGMKSFQELINDQARQYQDFMKSVTGVFNTGSKVAKPAHKRAYRNKKSGK